MAWTAAGLLAWLAVSTVRGNWRRFPVRGKIALITGSSRGLGLALAESFARAGARVVLTARDEAELEEARALLVERGAAKASDVLVVPCDLRERAEVTGLVGQVRAHWGEIDILVNNAGLISVGPVEAQPVEAFEEAIRSNYFSMVYASLAVLPAMLARQDGAIVNITSIGGKVAVPHLLPYSGSKFAAVGFSQGLHAEVRSKGVRVSTVTPGLLRTGSPRHALMVGNREEEFRWFNLGASLPGVARDAYGAAQRILRAAETGEAEFSITPQAALAARVAGLAPVLTTGVLSLMNRTLPAPQSEQEQPLPGAAVDGKDLEALTGMGRTAEALWNQR